MKNENEGPDLHQFKYNVLNWSRLSTQWNDHDTETAGAVLQAVHGSTADWDYPSTFVSCLIRGRQR